MKKVFPILLVFIALTSDAQIKQTEKLQQLWTGYLNQTRLTNRFGLWFDLQLRTKEQFVNDFSVLIVRPAVVYYFNDATRVAAGYAYINHFPADGHKDISQPEHRPWQQLQWNTRYNRIRTAQYIRLEERFRRKVLNDSTLASGHNFNYRVRYNFSLQVPLKPEVKKGSFSVLANDELQVSFGKQVVVNYFDQNRFFLGLAYHVNAHDNIQFGYLNVFQQLATAGRYRSISGARILYAHNLDLRRK
jgi:hypothetical protein